MNSCAELFFAHFAIADVRQIQIRISKVTGGGFCEVKTETHFSIQLV